jgi:hypothetical protein
MSGTGLCAQRGDFVVRLLQRFRSFSFAPELMPAGSLPPAHAFATAPSSCPRSTRRSGNLFGVAPAEPRAALVGAASSFFGTPTTPSLSAHARARRHWRARRAALLTSPMLSGKFHGSSPGPASTLSPPGLAFAPRRFRHHPITPSCKKLRHDVTPPRASPTNTPHQHAKPCHNATLPWYYPIMVSWPRHDTNLPHMQALLRHHPQTLP